MQIKIISVIDFSDILCYTDNPHKLNFFSRIKVFGKGFGENFYSKKFSPKNNISTKRRCFS